ncbi:calcineurin-like phosphoesterase C-terminal domain-containing protein [Leeuwenhoekiella sp. W20_SRS_FM14]
MLETSKHLWRATLPTKLPVGTHKIEVRATDQYGKTHSGEASYRLE